MTRGGRVSTKHQLKKKGGDESDEDYMVCEDDEFDESEDDYSYRISVDKTEGSLGESDEEKRTKKVNKVGKPTRQRNGGAAAKGRKKGIQEDDFGGELRMITSYSYAKGKAVHHSNLKPRKETNASYQEESEDSDRNDSDSPDEVDGNEVLPVMKKNKVNRVRVQEDLSAQRKILKRKLKNLKTTSRTKRGTRNDGGIRKLNVISDSDGAASGFSVYEYTISVNERRRIQQQIYHLILHKRRSGRMSPVLFGSEIRHVNNRLFVDVVVMVLRLCYLQEDCKGVYAHDFSCLSTESSVSSRK